MVPVIMSVVGLALRCPSNPPTCTDAATHQVATPTTKPTVAEDELPLLASSEGAKPKSTAKQPLKRPQMAPATHTRNSSLLSNAAAASVLAPPT